MTVATHSERYFPTLKESAKRFNIELIILGFNTKWTGFDNKISHVLNYIKNLKNNELIVFMDAFDSIFLKKFDNFEEDFKKNFKNNILISAHKIYPKNLIEKKAANYFAKKVWKSNTIDYCINSGMYAGYSNDLCLFLEESLKLCKSKKFGGNTDMRAFNHLYNTTWNNKLDIDKNQEIFSYGTNLNTAYIISAPLFGDLTHICKKYNNCPKHTKKEFLKYIFHKKNKIYFNILINDILSIRKKVDI